MPAVRFAGFRAVVVEQHSRLGLAVDNLEDDAVVDGKSELLAGDLDGLDAFRRAAAQVGPGAGDVDLDGVAAHDYSHSIKLPDRVSP